MGVRTVTGSIEADAEAEAILRILEDAEKIPEWAPAFADKVVSDGQGAWRVIKDGAVFSLEVVVEKQVRTVDYLREVAPGKKGGAYLRVLPQPGGGSVVVMTLPVTAGRRPEDVSDVLGQELASLVRMV